MISKSIWNLKSICSRKSNKTGQLAHNVVSTFTQRYMDVMDIRWTLFWRFVSAGVVYLASVRFPFAFFFIPIRTFSTKCYQRVIHKTLKEAKKKSFILNRCIFGPEKGHTFGTYSDSNFPKLQTNLDLKQSVNSF